MKLKSFILTSALFALSANVYAVDYTISQSGAWTDIDTWGGAGVPGADDRAVFAGGYTVDLTTAVTIAGIFYKNPSGDTTSNVLNITGSAAKLTITGYSNFYYNNRLDINVLDGAELDAYNIELGSGGYNNINVMNATFSSAFNQWNGSLVGDGSFVKFQSSGAGITSVTAKSAWDMAAAYDNAKNTLIVSGSGTTLNMNAQRLSLWASKAGAFTNAFISDGATIIGGAAINVGATGGGSSTLSLINSSFTATGNLTLSNSENSSNTLIIAGSTMKTSTIQIGAAKGTAKAVNSVTRLQFGGYNALGEFVAAGASSLTNTYEVAINESGTLTFILGDSNFSSTKTTTSEDAIFAGLYTKALLGALELDFSNVTALDDGTYYVALVSSTSNQSLLNIQGSGTATLETSWAQYLTANNTENVTFDGLSLSDNGSILYAQITVRNIPEPSTYAAIFGALALAFAAYSRRSKKQR